MSHLATDADSDSRSARGPARNEATSRRPHKRGKRAGRGLELTEDNRILLRDSMVFHLNKIGFSPRLIGFALGYDRGHISRCIHRGDPKGKKTRHMEE